MEWLPSDLEEGEGEEQEEQEEPEEREQRDEIDLETRYYFENLYYISLQETLNRQRELLYSLKPGLEPEDDLEKVNYSLREERLTIVDLEKEKEWEERKKIIQNEARDDENEDQEGILKNETTEEKPKSQNNLKRPKEKFSEEEEEAMRRIKRRREKSEEMRAKSPTFPPESPPQLQPHAANQANPSRALVLPPYHNINQNNTSSTSHYPQESTQNQRKEKKTKNNKKDTPTTTKNEGKGIKKPETVQTEHRSRDTLVLQTQEDGNHIRKEQDEANAQQNKETEKQGQISVLCTRGHFSTPEISGFCQADQNALIRAKSKR